MKKVKKPQYLVCWTDESGTECQFASDFIEAKILKMTAQRMGCSDVKAWRVILRHVKL